MSEARSEQAAALTPRRVVEALDRYIVGQAAAKRAVAVALRNRWRRRQVPGELRDEIAPKNIILIGPTGVGKTEIARRLARLARAPFVKVEASKFTEIGYVGRDVDSIMRDLVERAYDLVSEEAEARLRSRASAWAEEQLAAQLAERASQVRAPLEPQADPSKKAFIVGDDGVVQREEPALSDHEMLARRIRAGEFDEEYVEVEITEDRARSALDPLSRASRGAAAPLELGSIFEGLFQRPARKKRVLLPRAREIFERQEIDRLLDRDELSRLAVERAAEEGIVFLDELDKIASRPRQGASPDVSREGVQRDLLPIIEGTSVATRHGAIRSDHVLFVAAGAFHLCSPSDLMPELQGRFPIRVELESLTRQDFERILTEPRNALTRQYAALLATEGIEVEFGPGAVEAIAELATRANESLEDIGARRLHTIMERVFAELAFEAPEAGRSRVVITPEHVRARVEGLLGDAIDAARYIL